MVMQVVSKCVNKVDCVVLSFFTYMPWVEHCKQKVKCDEV